MILYNTPLLMVLGFLLLTLLVGLYGTQQATTFRAYAVGNRRLHNNTLLVTVLATTLGGGVLMREVPNVYEAGISRIIIISASLVTFWIVSLLGLRMGPFMHHLSIAETIGSVYGRCPRLIAALLAVCFSVGIAAIQINVTSFVIGICIDSIDPRIVTVLATLILITYAMLGGVRAITITDVLQFLTFSIIIPLLAWFVFVKTGKPCLEIMLLLKEQEKFQFMNLFQLNKLEFFFKSLWFAFFLDPPLIQRVYMASGPIQAYKVFLRATLFTVIILGSIMLISLFVFVGDATLSLTELWLYILADMSPAYKGCVAISLLGLTMSTTDSSLHAAAIIASHDIVESIRGIKEVPYVHQFRFAKLATLVIGLVAMIVTVYYPDLFELSDFVLTLLINFFVVTVVPPFILAVFRFRGSSRTALSGMTLAILIDLALKKWFEPKIGICLGVVPIIANGIKMMAAHYLLPQPAGKGWIGPNDQQKRMERLIRAFKKYKKTIDLE